MLSNNEVTEGLLIVVLGANFVLLFFIAWHVATARLFFRQVHRLAKDIVRKMDCNELIDEMLSCSGGTAEKQPYEGTAGDNLASPDACSGGGHEVTGQSRQQPAAPDRVQNYRERLRSVAARSMLRSSDLNKERKRHDQAVEHLPVANGLENGLSVST